MRTLLALSLLFTAFSAQAFQKYTYVDKSWTRSITQVFSADSRIVNGQELFDINSTLKIKVIGIKAGGYHETATTNEDFIPMLDARCRNPKKRGAKFGCYSRKFYDNGKFVLREYDAKNPTLDDTLTPSTAGVKTVDIATAFPEYNPETENVYNITGLFFITAQKDFGAHYNNRIVYVTGLSEIFKVKLNITQKAVNLEVKIDVLKHVKKANWKEDEGGSSLPGKFVYDMNRKIVTSMHLKTNSSTYVLKLVERKSQY